MPDYLARVVAAGMCTSIAVKPPVSGPPLLPGHRPSYPAFALPMTDVGQVEGQSMQADVSTKQVVPALPAATSAVNKQVPPRAVEKTQSQQQGLSMIDSTPSIRAPKALRPTHVSGSAPSQVNQEVHPKSSAAPNSIAATPMPSPAAPLPVAPREKVPIDEGPAMSSLSSPHKQVEGSDTPPIAALNPRVQPGVSDAPDRVTKDSERGVLPAQGSLKQAGTPPMPPAQVSVPQIPPANPTSRRVKLTIGQVDVRVNNRPPAFPARQLPSTGSHAVTDTLEQRYLDRFRLKP